jgi:hypothetical protein
VLNFSTRIFILLVSLCVSKNFVLPVSILFSLKSTLILGRSPLVQRKGILYLPHFLDYLSLQSSWFYWSFVLFFFAGNQTQDFVHDGASAPVLLKVFFVWRAWTRQACINSHIIWNHHIIFQTFQNHSSATSMEPY